MRRLRKGDEVIVIAGKDKGRHGTVLRVVDEDRIVVEGVNVMKKHTRPNPQRGVAGGIVEREMPVHVSNVAIYNPTSQKADRIGFKFLQDGRKVRYYKSTGEVVDI